MSPGNPSRFLSASEAAAMLGISRSSLYSYVSRGRIRAELDPKDPRISRYLATDVLRLRDGKEARLHPEIAARKTLRWGIPVLESSLTLIADGRFYYRGRDAVALARESSFEDVIHLLWNAPDGSVVPPHLSRRCRAVLKQLRSLAPMQRMQALLPVAAADDGVRGALAHSAVAAIGWRVLHVMVAAATLQEPPSACDIANSLARGWKVTEERATRAINAALVLCADHELNVSAFAARVAASTRSSPYEVVAAGLAALAGPLHGGHTTQVEALLDEAGSPARVRTLIAERRRRSEAVPGFGHPLYPAGDPRCRVLFGLVRRHWADSDAARYLLPVSRAGRELLDDYPTVDFGLVMLRRALGLPPGSALVLFAIGRTAGWIAHAIEQYATGGLIRPRAAYVGSTP